MIECIQEKIMEGIHDSRIQELSQVLKALGHPTRLFIMETIQKQPTCVCELQRLIKADTSTISKHLSILRNAGLVTLRKEGTMVFYSPSCDCIERSIHMLTPLLEQKHKRYTEMMK